MITKEEVIDQIIKSRLVETCVQYQAKKVSKYTKDDIIQDTFQWLLEYPEEKLLNAYENKHLNALITGYLTRQLFSNNSAHWRRYKRFDLQTEEIRYDDEEDGYGEEG